MRDTAAIIAVVSLLLLPGVAARAAPADSMGVRGERARLREELVRLGGHVITRRELETYFQLFHLTDELREGVDLLPPLEREEFYARGRSEALNQLVERRLMLEDARDSYPDPAALQEELDGLVERHVRRKTEEWGSAAELHAWLRRRGLRLSDWKELTADVLLLQAYEGEKITSRVHVSPQAARRYYRQHREEFRRPRTVIYRCILVDPADCQTPDDEMAVAQTILQAIRGGADFAEMADTHSLDRDRRKGGLHEVEAPPDEPDWLPPVCAGLEPGQVSEVRRTAAGCMIARLEEVRPSFVPPFEQVQQEVRGILAEHGEAEVRRELIRRLRAKIQVEPLPAGERMLR